MIQEVMKEINQVMAQVDEQQLHHTLHSLLISDGFLSEELDEVVFRQKVLRCV